MSERNWRDMLDRPMRDLRISVTDRCNFRCSYCMPLEEFGKDHCFLPQKSLLTFDEIHRLTVLLAKKGIKKIRITGGEPLLRPKLEELITKLTKVQGIEDIGLTTNGLLLKQKAKLLYKAGLRRLNISLDALDPSIFKTINGVGVSSNRILENIDYAKELGFKIKVNMVVQKGLNDLEIISMADYFKSRQITLRFIEYMDVGNRNGWKMERVLLSENILQMISQNHQLESVEAEYVGEVAKRYQYKDTQSEIGFISSISNAFCHSCTRVRLSSDGTFFNCLFANEGLDIRKLLREGKDDGYIIEALKEDWTQRSDQYSSERESVHSSNRKKRDMVYMGG